MENDISLIKKANVLTLALDICWNMQVYENWQYVFDIHMYKCLALDIQSRMQVIGENLRYLV